MARLSTVVSTPLQPVYAIKTKLTDPGALSWVFEAQKTMYGGKLVAVGDPVYVFASENEGGAGLVAVGRVSAATNLPRRPGAARQTPRVSISVQRTALALRPLGRSDLKPFSDWHDGQAQTELNFKLYRQATDKVVGLSAVAAAFLATRF